MRLARRDAGGRGASPSGARAGAPAAALLLNYPYYDYLNINMIPPMIYAVYIMYLIRDTDSLNFADRNRGKK